ncbi:MAG TPA: LacI family DNA-binding transcriptional regulator [Caldilineaceae bacterium]|nr:LacI family DNA-binding transcriptional regulator [Caldilineaceae bacterium]
MPPTMEDVARQAGVSKSTVSLVLNDKPGVSPELKQAVRRAAEELGYRLSRARSAQWENEPRTLAVVHAQPEPNSPHEVEPTGLYLNYLNGVQAFARKAGLNLTLIADYREGDPQQLAFHLLQEASFDGFILMGWSARQENPLVHQLIERQTPAVALSRFWPDLPISTVGPNYHQQVSLAVNHLLHLGHRQIAFVARDDDQRLEWYRWRLRSYQELIAAANGAADEALIALGVTTAEAVRGLLARRSDVTAIFAGHDGIALEVLAALQALGLRVPQDISVVGQDGDHHQPEPTLTTVGFSHFDVGYLAAELVQQQIEKEASFYGHLWVQSYLVERGSCAAPRQEPLPLERLPLR